MSEIEFRLPWPPSDNVYYVCIHGRKVISKKGRLYAEEVRRLIQKGGLVYGIDCPVEVFVKLAPPRSTTGIWDCSNYIKALWDSITKSGFWTDDSLVYEHHVKKLPNYAMGEVYLTVRELENES